MVALLSIDCCCTYIRLDVVHAWLFSGSENLPRAGEILFNCQAEESFGGIHRSIRCLKRPVIVTAIHRCPISLEAQNIKIPTTPESCRCRLYGFCTRDHPRIPYRARERPWTFARASAEGPGKQLIDQFPTGRLTNCTIRRCSASLGLSHTIAIFSRCVDVVVTVELRGLGGFDFATTGVRHGKQRTQTALQ
jgi:hypothetical protein